MYCFSSICRICLTSNKTDLQNLNNSDTDNIKINDKLIFCIPEIFNPHNNLPDSICGDCCQFIQRMYEFKQLSIENTIKLNKYASKLSSIPGVFDKNNLTVTLVRDLEIDKLLEDSNILTDEYDLSEETDSSTDFSENEIQFEDDTSLELEIKANPGSEIQTSPGSEVQTSPRSEIQTSPGLEIQTSPRSEIQTSPGSEIQTNPLSEIQTSPRSKNQKSSQLDNKTSPRLENQTSPLLDNQTSPLLDNQTSPLLDNKTSPRSDNQTSPRSENQTSSLLDNKTSPLLVNQTSPRSENQTSPLLKNQTSPLLDNQINTQLEIKESPQSDTSASPHSIPETLNNSFNHSPSISAKTTAKEVSMYSVSLNKWDLFETKYTCRCIKEFSSFTENTTHLCKNCKGELLGFHLSKIKAGAAENRINTNVATIKYEDETNDNDDSFDESDTTDSENNESNDYERGFDYSDFQLCETHINGVNKQIDQLEDNLGLSDGKIKSSYENHTCPICKKIFSARYYLNKHFLSHSGNNLHKCDHCNEKFSNKNELDKHKLKHYKLATQMHFLTPTTSKCQPIVVESDSEEEEHNLSISPGNSELNSSGEIAACATCDKVFESKGKLAIHLMTHVGKKEFKCSTCQKEFIRKENYDLHLETHHMMSSPNPQDIKYKCPICEKVFSLVHYVRRHIRETHVIKRYTCVICDQAFDDKRKLERHISLKHTLPDDVRTNDKKYLCPNCDKTFIKVIYVRRHMREFHDIKRFICPLCDEVYDDKEMLEEHVFDAHAVKENLVDKETKLKLEKESKPKLKKELKLKLEKESKQKIDIESKPKIEKKSKQQMFAMESDKKYKCPYCVKSYFHSTNVRRHINKYHDDMSDVVIPKIEKTYKDDEEQENMETKSNINTYPCPHCDRVFHYLLNMRKHVRRVHGVKEHFCSICNEKFDEKQTLDEHVFVVHNTTNYEDDDDQQETDYDDADDDDDDDDDDDQYQIDDDHKKTNDSHSKDSPKYKCTYCDKRYYYVSTVRRHIRDNHKVNDKYLCSICTKTFTDKRILEEHIFSVHTQAENKNSPNEDKQKGFSCPVCHKHFLHLSNLRMHALSHQDDVLEQQSSEFHFCNVCKKNISRKTSMNRHMMTHIRGKVLNCAACAAKFDNRWVLRQHMKSKHPNFIPIFKCNDCLKIYSTNHSLQKHRQQIHNKYH